MDSPAFVVTLFAAKSTLVTVVDSLSSTPFLDVPLRRLSLSTAADARVKPANAEGFARAEIAS